LNVVVIPRVKSYDFFKGSIELLSTSKHILGIINSMAQGVVIRLVKEILYVYKNRRFVIVLESLQLG
jgi:hypothetical protein